ncbi:hypothetical protein CA13_11140 [Planctomycetes bacterium CA13]|uniref:Uncharacterized protein n=1 Tax=Novipirellula herctigrandis TaxID=2527986 RepID=A0A5C5YYQ1_9BACT|nr:hypothetical protein CA13_11140 [Planctomycetes bacterium CA13]
MIVGIDAKNGKMMKGPAIKNRKKADRNLSARIKSEATPHVFATNSAFAFRSDEVSGYRGLWCIRWVSAELFVHDVGIYVARIGVSKRFRKRPDDIEP